MSDKIILASGSERRKMLLEGLGFEVQIIIPNTPEIVNNNLSPEQNAQNIAVEKLDSLGRDVLNSGLPIICADTIVVCNNKIYGKPASLEGAKAMLGELSGKMHEVMTGYAIQLGTHREVGLVKTAVFFRDLSEREISNYVNNNELLDKSGSYAIQGPGSGLVARIDGSISNVIGLPVQEVLDAILRLKSKM